MDYRNNFVVLAYVFGVKESNETMHLVITIFGKGVVQYGG